MTTFQTKPAVPASAAILCMLLAILCMLLAIATLAGWGLHSPSLIGAPQMYPLTAAGFVCAGASVLLQLHPVRPIARAGRLPALLLLALGLGGAAMRFSGWAPAPPSLGLGAASNAWSLPAPLTDGLFVVLGASLALWACAAWSPWPRRWPPACCCSPC